MAITLLVCLCWADEVPPRLQLFGPIGWNGREEKTAQAVRNRISSVLSYLGNQADEEVDSHIRLVLGLPYIVLLFIYLDLHAHGLTPLSEEQSRLTDLCPTPLRGLPCIRVLCFGMPNCFVRSLSRLVPSD